ncbi:MAG: hypothetical protein PHU85_12380 [Phycisphaerae bacterium]|nr:hypothetical protein [Phycisphaerae bacterium]
MSRQIVAGKMAAYLRRRISLKSLVAWAELALMDGQFEENDVAVVRDVVARLGLADVRAFGLTWEDCQRLLRTLGYATRVAVEARGGRSVVPGGAR